MTTDAELTLTEQKPVSDGRYMSPMTFQNMLNEIALGRLSYRQIAGKYNRSYGYIRQVAAERKEEIEEIQQQYKDELAILWVTDRFNRQLERQYSLARIEHQQEALFKSIQEASEADNLLMAKELNDMWKGLEALKKGILKDIAEEEGQLPTRSAPVASDQSKMTYTVTGIDLGEAIKNWQNAQ